MKFKVVGQNRETGARMSLEFEAESRAAAERKATQSGMSVHHVQDVTDGYPATAMDPGGARRRGKGGSGGVLILILLLAAAVAAYLFRGTIMGLLHH